jgi:hypothetical protein
MKGLQKFDGGEEVIYAQGCLRFAEFADPEKHKTEH